MEAALERFRAADTQVMGVSIDSKYSHANWGKDLGGVSFPLLADFHPKGGMAKSYAHFLADIGITDRSTVIIDKSRKVQYTASVGPSGERDIDALIAECERIQAGQGTASNGPEVVGIPAGTKLYVKSNCGPSRSALVAIDNLHLSGQVEVINVSDDAAANKELKGLAGSDQAPCLSVDGKAIQDAAVIVKTLADRCAPIR